MITPKKLFLRIKNKSFRGDDRGGVTIEFVLWAPVFAALIAGAVDISLAFMNQSNFWNIARDTARIYSRHAMSVGEAEAYAEANARFGNTTPDAKLTFPSANEVTVTISAPATTIDAFGIFGIFEGTIVKASVTHRMEPQ